MSCNKSNVIYNLNIKLFLQFYYIYTNNRRVYKLKNVFVSSKIACYNQHYSMISFPSVAIILIVLLLLYNNTSDNTPPKVCYPWVGERSVIIGYGSLMNRSSLKASCPNARVVAPVLLRGYKRKWDAGSTSSTYLGVVHTNNNEDVVNAVAISIESDELATLDKREDLYCRRSVLQSSIVGGQINDLNNIWIYETRPHHTKLSSPLTPVSNKYIDTFLEGCKALSYEFNIQNFYLQCISTTHGWVSIHL